MHDCPYCMENRDTLFEKIAVSDGQKLDLHSQHAMIAFLLKGDVCFVCNSIASNIVCNSVFAIPSETDCGIVANGDCILVLFNIRSEGEFPNCLRRYLVGKPEFAEDDRQTLCLTISPSLNDMMLSMANIPNDGMHCRSLKMSVMQGIAYMIMIDNPSHDLARFIYSYFPHGNVFKRNHDNHFRQIVLQNRNRYFQVKDFSTLVHMSSSAFRTNFRRIFGVTPQMWIVEERKKMIFRELTASDRPIQEIYEMAGFSSPQEFSKFCKNHFGEAPTIFRKHHQAAS